MWFKGIKKPLSPQPVENNKQQKKTERVITNTITITDNE